MSRYDVRHFAASTSDNFHTQHDIGRVHEALRSREAASHDEEEEEEEDSSESEEPTYPVGGSSRNMYQTTYRDESDEDVDISSDDEEHSSFQHTNGSSNLPRRPSTIHRGRGRPPRHSQQHHHGTRTAVAAARPSTPPKRLFFSNGASAPPIRRLQLWDGTPMYDGPVNAVHSFPMSGGYHKDKLEGSDIVMAVG